MTEVEKQRAKIVGGGCISRAEALALYAEPLEALCAAADAIRLQFCGTEFDLCTILNGKSGRCSEDCKYCAQSAHHATCVEEYPLLGTAEIVAHAKEQERRGAVRHAVVTSGKRLSPAEVDRMCETFTVLKQESALSLCASFGLLEEADFRRLKAAGVRRIHNNLETSRRYFPQICSTHSFEEKCRAIQAAQRAGLTVCSGGILGMGETREDRIDLAFSLKELGIQSVPLNLLNPIPGTPFAALPRLPDAEVRRTVAVFRFILPNAFIRLAGGRGLLEDKGAACFRSGANAAISGNMLSTAGICLETDRMLLQALGYRVVDCHV